MELEADNAGITEMLEKRMSPPYPCTESLPNLYQIGNNPGVKLRLKQGKRNKGGGEAGVTPVHDFGAYR